MCLMDTFPGHLVKFSNGGMEIEEVCTPARNEAKMQEERIKELLDLLFGEHEDLAYGSPIDEWNSVDEDYVDEDEWNNIDEVDDAEWNDMDEEDYVNDDDDVDMRGCMDWGYRI
jgi:hypothetical protein